MIVMDTSSTITVASLASVIAFGLIRMLLRHPKFSVSIKSKLFNMSARVGSLSPTASTDEVIVVEHRRKSRATLEDAQ